jgi:hypothetical protein
VILGPETLEIAFTSGRFGLSARRLWEHTELGQKNVFSHAIGSRPDLNDASNFIDVICILTNGFSLVGFTLYELEIGKFPRNTGDEVKQISATILGDYAAAAFIRMVRNHLEPLMAEGIREMSLECQAWLQNALLAPFDGTTVVVADFAPSLKSADPRYGLTPGTAGFCAAVDDLFPLASVWMHGHLHCPNDYVVESKKEDGLPWACRVVANPRGYFSNGEQAAFRENLVIEVPS